MNVQDGNGKKVSEFVSSEGITVFPRRHFLKLALIGATGSGLFISTLANCEIATNKVRALPQQAIGFISRVSVEESACASCGLCSLVCASVHGAAVGPSHAGIWLERKPFECEYNSITCQQCDEPECLDACEEEALYIENISGARVIDIEKCIGCKQCIEACVYEEPRIQWDEKLKVAFKCDLCSGRPEGPACVEFCPRQALILAKETDV